MDNTIAQSFPVEVYLGLRQLLQYLLLWSFCSESVMSVDSHKYICSPSF